MSKRAFIFPGQGSQYVGMGKTFHDTFRVAREVFQEADDRLHFSISRLCFQGPEDALKLTENTQPAILTTSIAVLRVVEAETGLRADVCAGHSLGEYSALVCAGALAFTDAVRLTRQRGLFMQEAVPAGQGAMSAVLGLDPAKVTEICAAVARETGEVVSPANFNEPAQTVIAGSAGAEAAGARARCPSTRQRPASNRRRR